MTNEKTAIAYIRVSTEEQAAEGVSIEAQREKLVAWCTVNEHELVEVYIDAGLSGGRADNRPELQRALDHVTRIGGALVVYRLSRLARSTRDTLAIADRLDRAGADLVSLSEKIDTSTAAGKMVFRMLAVLAEFERDLICEQTCSALAYKRNKGERIGKTPFGYDLDDDGVHLVENDLEQGIIREITILRSDGYSLRAIAAELDRRGVMTKEQKPTWTHTAVKRILDRKVA